MTPPGGGTPPLRGGVGPPWGGPNIVKISQFIVKLSQFIWFFGYFGLKNRPKIEKNIPKKFGVGSGGPK